MYCTKHDHSSKETALRCWQKMRRQKLKRRMKYATPEQREQTYYDMGRWTERGSIPVLVFEEDLKTKY